MNNNDAPLWSNQQNVGDAVMDTRIEDFTHYLDFGNVTLELGDAGSHGFAGDHSRHHHHSHHHHHQHHDPNAMDTSGYSNTPPMEPRSGMNEHLDAAAAQLCSGEMINFGLQALQQQQQQQQQLAMQEVQLRRGSLRQNLMNGNIVPPTPTSMDLRAADYTSQMYSHQMFICKDDQMFTPLVSPAVTPVETSFGHLPDFSIPGTYFSPLTSPALEAQRHGVGYIHTYYGGSKDPSSIEFTDSSAVKAKISQIVGRRKSVASTGRNASRIGKSPGMGPQRKKKLIPLTPATGPKDCPPTASRESFSSGNNITEHIVIPSGRESSSESISPEPMPEPIMAPPPRRVSLSQGISQSNNCSDATATVVPGSPSHLDQQHSSSAKATPLSIMKLSKFSIPADAMNPSPLAVLDNDAIMENLEINSPSPVSPGWTNADDQSTPIINPSTNKARTSTRNDASFVKPNSAPSSQPSRQQSPSGAPQGGIRTLPNSAASTPILAPGNSKQTNAPSSKPPPKSSSSSNRKRQSISHSPALIPKISPNIKPLLPSTLSSLETSASILLAKKSNYENIVEGTSSSLGLRYPEHLSTNLTSKRTSHKIAEQGRRNRINNALQEIAGLLPPPNTPSLKAAGVKEDGVDEDGEDGSGGGNGKETAISKANQAAQTSKAVTVERAIEYIKLLKRELEEARGELDATRSRLTNYEEMGKRGGLQSEGEKGDVEEEEGQAVDSGFVDGDRAKEEKRRRRKCAESRNLSPVKDEYEIDNVGGSDRPRSRGSDSSSNRGSMVGSPKEKAASESSMVVETTP